jgi:hypothetical protein
MRIATSLAVLLALSTSALAQPFQHSSGEWRQYNADWLSACPNAIHEDATDFYGYSCFSSTGSQELNDANLPAYKLTLIHDRLDGEIDLAITVAPASGEYDPDRPMLLRFGGEVPIVLTMATDMETRHNTINQFFLIGADRDAVLSKMRERNALILSVPLVGIEKPVESRMSLRGVLASLDFMSTYARKVAQY